MVSERDIYKLELVEVSVEDSAAMGAKDEMDGLEYHYYYINNADYFVDVSVYEESYCTRELESY